MLKRIARWAGHRPLLAALLCAVFAILVVDLLAVHVPRIISEPAGDYYEHARYQYGMNDPVLAALMSSTISIDNLMEQHDRLFMVLSTIAIAWFTGTLWRATDALRTLAVRQGEDMQRSISVAEDATNAARVSADAAKESVKVAREHYVAEHRPWIGLELEPVTPLVYDSLGWDAGLRWHIGVRYRLKHFGETPAAYVSVTADMIPFMFMRSTTGGMSAAPDGTDVPKELERLCAALESAAKYKMGFGRVMFPHEIEERQFEINASPARFEEASRNSMGYSGQFIVLMGVTYGSALSGEIYKTGKTFLLYKEDGPIDLKGESVFMSDMRLSEYPLIGGSIAT